MLKSQDVVVLLKLLSTGKSHQWQQKELAESLYLSVATINASLRRLHMHHLILYDIQTLFESSYRKYTYLPIIPNCIEFLTKVVKYIWPAVMKERHGYKKVEYIHPCLEKMWEKNTDIELDSFFWLNALLNKLRLNANFLDGEQREKVEAEFIEKIEELNE